ncbi:uncharacterized protein EI97DRAFT_375109 [Westerdykella ornata]|uniref:Dynamin family protein n=1 Tax=Westerdykella ornata TaxID=318751 RepID=A0A6A6JLR9_WESOR|nr:uncharacterized protein EI97DRAFT_375109 [Westerdykella ornata]KAF2277447.1 hypothetical protein EI97DRAFT_375109 [Westerdykella ornata]
MASQPPEPATIKGLQSSKQVALLDAIDNLRELNKRHEDYNIDPQLIVCGDQSSGKSSVLEGLTSLSFPTKEGTCTTFATEVALRRGTDVRITCSISPGEKRSQAQIQEISKFHKFFTQLEDVNITALIEEAKSHMIFGASSNTSSFFDDVLKIKYVGPDVPPLTIVDLPGLIQSAIKGRENDVEQVHNLVKRYMDNPKSIILAVVSAQNDLNNQAVFKMVQRADREGQRSLGIITKPDLLNAGSETEATVVRLANNEIMRLDLGWHVVRNRGWKEEELSLEERNQKEREFFASSIWKALPECNVGIDSLRTKLSELLLRHVCKELPAITGAIRDAIVATNSRLARLGEGRETPREQRSYLTDSAAKFQLLTHSALIGHYDGDAFFTSTSVQDQRARRLRTQIQSLNRAFAHIMYHKGHAWNIANDLPTSANLGSPALQSQALQQYDAQFDDPEQITRAELLKRIKEYLEESDCSGIPTLVNPGVVTRVFRDQSQQWEFIAECHLERVFEAAQKYIYAALSSLMDEQTFQMLRMEWVDQRLEERRIALEAKLKELLVPYQKLSPFVYDPTFSLQIHQMRAERYTDNASTAAHRAFRFGSNNSSGPSLLTQSPDDDTYAEVLDHSQTYYKKALTVFIDNVAVLAVENCLIADLAEIFSPKTVSEMNEDLLRLIASESDEIRAERIKTEKTLARLKEGKRELERAQVFDTLTGK